MDTFYSRGGLDTVQALLIAAFIGVAFGFWLERAGFGSSRKLTGIFYFRDAAVLQVMFTAVVTALVGLELLTWAGIVAPSTVYQMETFLWPQIVGGLVFGVGFVMGGWCPGTALVGLASGKGDALVFLLGAGLGSLVYAFAYPSLGGFDVAGACGVIALPETLELERHLTAALLVGAALVAFLLVEIVGRRRRTRTAVLEEVTP